MAKYITNKIKQKYVQVLADLRADIGREVVLLFPNDVMNCPNCGFDPQNKKSNNKYEPDSPYPTAALVNAGVATIGPVDFAAQGIRICPVCRGKGQIEIADRSKKVVCLVNSLSPQEAEKTPLGKNFQWSYELQTTIDFRADFMNAKKLIIDGSACEVVAVIPNGIGDLTQISVYAGGGV